MQADAPAPALSLQTLLPPLLELILRFLPLGEKVVQLSHLSSSFRPLTPACFSDDALDLTKKAVSAAVSRPSLSSLLSRVRGVSVTASCSWSRGGRHVEPTLQSPRLEPAVSAFTGLRSIKVHLSSWGESRGDLTGPITALAPLTQLQTLALCNGRQYHTQRDDELAILPSALLCLSQLQSLRSLTLSGVALHPGSLLFLCSLPLEELQLSQSDFVRSAEPAAGPFSAPPSALTLRSLSLPALHASAQGREEALRAVAAYGADRSADEQRAQPVQLSWLECSTAADSDEEMQRLLCSVPSLTQLSLVVRQETELAACLTSRRLPTLQRLQHVRLKMSHHSLPAHPAARLGPPAEDEVMTAAERPEDWLAAAAGSCVSFLSSYSSQLLTLSINLLPNLPSAVSLLQAAVRCGQLRRLQLSGVYIETNSTEHRFDHNLVCPALCFTPLPQLHTLSLSHLHLSSEQLTALLQNCPLLEDATMTAMPGFSLELLPVIGRSCRRLKQLALLDCDKAFFSQTVQGDASDGSSIVVFPSLLYLKTQINGLCDCCKLPAPPLATLQWLRTVLQSSPALQYLHLACDESGELLSALIPLTRLRGVMVRKGWAWSRRRRFFVEHHSSSYSSEQRRVDCWPPQSSAV